MKQLNNQQRQIVENNLKLVYKVVSELGLSNNMDAIQEGAKYLCLAAMKYDETKSKFSTFAYHYVRGGILEFLKADHLISRRTIKKKVEITYTDIDLVEISDNSSMDDYLVQISQRQYIQELMKRSDDMTKLIIQMMYEGYTQIEIAQKIGNYQSFVSRKLSELRRREEQCQK